jgi:hypothetical protein
VNIYQHYVDCVKENLLLKKEEYFFKSDTRYQYVLEHVAPEQGRQYLSLIREEFEDLYKNNKELLVDLCKRNDEVGKPNKSYFFKFCSCSPTNLRYIYQSLLILKYMRDKLPPFCNGCPVVEIGGGYGGLAFFIHNLCEFFDVEIKSYIIFDIPEVCLLQEKYLRHHEVELEEKENITENSFLISNYAFSELPENIRDTYEKNVIAPYCDYGFLSWNACPFYKFIDDETIIWETEPEKPITGNNNLFVRFLKQCNM